MLDMLNERKELDIAFTYEEGEDSSNFDIFIFASQSLLHIYR